jgi:hypothetical protein
VALDSGRLIATVAAVGLLTAPVAGCGGPSHSSSTSSSAATVASTSSASTTTSTTTHKTTRNRTTTHHTSSTSTSTGGASTAPPPTPAGTPPAPDGLRQTTGYGSYDLCAGTCSGAVPASLRRPLHLPHGCPGTGDGGSPVSPQGGADIKLTQFIGSSWSGARVIWIAQPSYSGPVLIRGGRTDGGGAVGFGEGHVPLDELQFLGSGQQAPPPPPGGRSWLSFSRVRGPGCYAYQVDGTSFSRVIAFRAR